jgi:hypothetical protein
MVTNRKIDPTVVAAFHLPSVREAPHESFIGVLRRRAAGDDLAQLRAQRLGRWNELGRHLEAVGWFRLESALEMAHAMLDHTTHPRFTLLRQEPGFAAIDAEEAERLAQNFLADCECIIDAGGAAQLWHILVTDRERCAQPSVDSVSIEKLDAGDTSETALLLDAAHCYALAAFAAADSGADREAARLLFTGEGDVEMRERCAPFAVDNRVDDREDRVNDAAYQFATARTNLDRLEAAESFAVGREAVSERYDVRPIQRMGLISWLASRMENEAAIKVVQ